jgi:hypothetical protein
MKSSRQVQQIVGQARLQADQVTDARILGDARAALVANMNNRPQAPRPGPAVWRTIMESRITKYSVAATLILTASLVLVNPFARNAVVLAEVAQKLSETRTVMHKEKRAFWLIGEDKPFFEGEVRKYISTDIGFMEEQYDANGAVEHRFYLLKEGQIIIVFPKSKRYIKLPAQGRIYDELLKMSTPAGLVKYFLAMPHTKLGRSRVGGSEAEGFEVSHVDFSWLMDYIKYLFPVQNLSARMWVDADTSLPVGIEMKVDAGRGFLNGFRKVHGEFTAYDFQWGPELPEGILDPNIPADYTQIDLGSIASENAAWLGIGAPPVIGLAVRRRRRSKTPTAA